MKEIERSKGRDNKKRAGTYKYPATCEKGLYLQNLYYIDEIVNCVCKYMNWSSVMVNMEKSYSVRWSPTCSETTPPTKGAESVDIFNGS